MKDFVLAEFGDEAALCAAARRLRELGHVDLDAHSPVPLHDADEALGLRKSVVPWIAFVAGTLGAIGGYFMQYWMNAVDYPINVANRGYPYHSPPANVPITFECTVLLSVLAIVFGLFALCRFPRPHHPAFDHEPFRTHSIDALWLTARVDARDAAAVADELRRLGGAHVAAVPEEFHWDDPRSVAQLGPPPGDVAPPPEVRR